MAACLGTGVTQVHAVEKHQPICGGLTGPTEAIAPRHPALHLESQSLCGQGHFVVKARSVETDPTEWCKELVSAEGSSEVVERFNSEDCVVCQPGGP